MRTLASIQEISTIRPAENADALDIARIEGWDVVVRKGEFKPGDKIVYLEIDSILPPKPEFLFMEQRHYRVKTIKLRGNISQGLILPISLLPPAEYAIGADVTGFLGVTKYDVPEQMEGCKLGKCTPRGNFPYFIPQTDEARIQSNIGILQRWIGANLYITEKIDGSSITIFWSPIDGLHVCSRKLDMKELSTNLWWRTVRDIGMDEVAKSLGEVAIQGELYGPGVQGNKYKMKKNNIAIYSIYDIRAQKYMPFEVWWDALESIGLKDRMVPLIDRDFVLNHDVDALVKLSNDKSRVGPCLREGIVFRTKTEQESDYKIGRLSFKAINPEFNAKYGE